MRDRAIRRPSSAHSRRRDAPRIRLARFTREGAPMIAKCGKVVGGCMLIAALAFAGLGLAADSAGPIAQGDTAAMLKEAVAGAWRSPANKARDQYRHPVETLEFFGIKPDMTVVELAPGGGWYTE